MPDADVVCPPPVMGKRWNERNGVVWHTIVPKHFMYKYGSVPSTLILAPPLCVNIQMFRMCSNEQNMNLNL